MILRSTHHPENAKAIPELLYPEATHSSRRDPQGVVDLRTGEKDTPTQELP
jgi:hypothetical protein